MKFKKCSVVVMSLFAALAIPVCMAAQDNPSQDHKPKHKQYKLIDMGTFGGPNSSVPSSFLTEGGNQVISNQGTVAGIGDTSTADPLCYFDDCFYPNAFQWQKGVLTNLGTLPGSQWSAANWISGNGLIAGTSENGENDPLSGLPEFRAVLWNEGKISDLGTLEGGYESAAFAANNRGQVAGFATNTIPDPFSFFPPTQTRAFLSQNGAMQDLATLGGPDAWAFFVNERGQVSGESYTNSIPNSSNGVNCSPNVPTQDPFIYERGGMIDLGTLGGTCGSVNGLNNQGQVVGLSNLAGNLTFHPFFWDRGVLRDLGTLGGDNGQADWINDAGDVVGKADLPGSQTHDGFLWEHGVMTDLGTLTGDRCSRAKSINGQRQIVGNCSVDCVNALHPFLWEKGGPMVDLNTLIPPGSGLTLMDAFYINDRGEIAGDGVLSNGDTHAFLLIPTGDCDDDCEGRIAASQNTAAPVQNAATMKQASESSAETGNPLRNRFGRGFHLPGQPAAPRD